MAGYNIADIQYRFHKTVTVSGKESDNSGYLDEVSTGVLLLQLSINQPERVGIIPTIKGLVVEAFPEKTVLTFSAAFMAPLRERKYVKDFFKNITETIDKNTSTEWKLDLNDVTKHRIAVPCVVKSFQEETSAKGETFTFNISGNLLKEMPWMGTFATKRY